MSKHYRNLFFGLDTPILLQNGQSAPAINFDNGATTPPLNCVIDAVIKNALVYGPIARGAGQKGEICTRRFEDGRNVILDFFHLNDNQDYTVIYTKTTTESLNILANILISDKHDLVLATRMEHHANDLPWRKTATVIYVDVDRNGRIHLSDIEKALIEHKGKIKYVTITGASNVTGYINDIHGIACLCHQYGAKIIVDGAQLIAHKEVNMMGNNPGEQIDFLVFSAHKAYAPFGAGAIVGLKNELEKNEPFLRGGGCVDAVFDEAVMWSPPPARLESGSPNFLGVMAMVSSLQALKAIGMNNVYEHEMQLKNYLISQLKANPNVILYGDVFDTSDRLGVISFNLKNMAYYDVSKKLADQYGIATRYAKFCAHPYVYRLLGIDDDTAYEQYIQSQICGTHSEYGLVRVSLGLYNTIEEAQIFIQAIKELSACR